MIHPNATYVRPMKRAECVLQLSFSTLLSDQGYCSYASSVLMLFLNVAILICKGHGFNSRAMQNKTCMQWIKASGQFPWLLMMSGPV